ncbi:MAG: TetR-like C-terminal domain-containing protein, partial [Chloroflexota bacterium]
VFNKIHTVIFSESANSENLDVLQLLTLSFEQWQLHSEELKWVLQVENKDMLISALRTHIEAIKSGVEEKFPFPESLSHFEDHVTSFISGGLYMLIKDWINGGMQESAETMGKVTFVLLDTGFSPMRVWSFAQGNQISSQPDEWQTILTSLEYYKV